ncbi:hypothetical protein BC629DRAFT_1502772 [Irpex lacteus]|nr:hypothetical protein BC629DRAFT_1502772 [Irpex lacteus]
MPVFTHAFPPQPDGRTRYVAKQWIRDPNGPLLKKPGPIGVRTPSGLIWGHDLNDFFWIERIPGRNIMTIWSRSMIQNLGENYDEREFDHPDGVHYPRRHHAWPLLKVPKDFKKWETPRVKEEYGIIDPGCEVHARLDYKPNYRDDDGTVVEMTKIDHEFEQLVKRLIGVENDGAWVRNDPKNPVKDRTGRRYTMLWAPATRQEMLEGIPEGVEVPLKTMHPYPFTTMQMDAVGVHILTALDDDALDALGGPSLPIPEGEKKSTSASSSSKAGSSSKSTTSAPNKKKTAPTSDVDMSGSSVDNEPSSKADTVIASTSATSDNTKTESSAADIDVDMADGTNASASKDSTATANVEKSDGDTKEHVSTPARVTPAPMDALTEKTKVPLDSPYSVEDIPKLEEFLPIEYYPDYIHVHDPNAVTSADLSSYGYRKRDTTRKETIVYKRTFPKLPRDPPANQSDSSPPRVAHLHLAQTHRFGVGHHSLVHHAPLTLPEPLSAHSRNGRVVVAAKSAFRSENARYLLQREGRTYDAFPRHLSEDWCGYNLVTPIKHPVPVGPVVPKFYGYYVPIKIKEGKEVMYEEKDLNAPSPILLMEECGEPVNPAKFTVDMRSECYSMMVRLHYAGFVQNSFFVRNILVQPGPLTAPPEKRSKKTPSFRLIDFGRAVAYKRFVEGLAGDQLKNKVVSWHQMVRTEDDQARNELCIENLQL